MVPFFLLREQQENIASRVAIGEYCMETEEQVSVSVAKYRIGSKAFFLIKDGAAQKMAIVLV